jgi:DNA-binding protein Fis
LSDERRLRQGIRVNHVQMKRIVAFMVPVAEAESPLEMPSNGSGPAAHDSDTSFDPTHLPAGAMKLEVVVSDVQAKRILAAILEPGAEPEAGKNVESLLQKELEEAGPDATDLFERIVVDVERRLISQVYSDCDRVKTHAAARLGINRNTLLKKLREYRLIDEQV